jgi:hypothetical protein
MANGKMQMAHFIFAIFLLPCCLLSEPLSENQSRFGVITGDVGLLTQGADDWIEPHEGLPIEPGDHIRTGEDGQVELVLSDNALWWLEPQTEAVMEHTETNAGRLDLSSGTLLGDVDSARAAGIVQRWEFNTPAAVIAVHGTEFAIEVVPRQEARLGVFEGMVEMQPAETAEGPQPPVQVSEGQESISKRGKSIQTLAHFSPRMKILLSKRPSLEKRLKRVQDTWSPFTPSVRATLRSKFVAAPKPHPHRSPPGARRRKVPVPTDSLQ